MNKNKQFIALLLGLVLFMVSFLSINCAVGRPAVPRMYTQVEVSFDTFHQVLSPYGHWVMVGGYGTCWRPSGVYVGWRPYFDNGYWAYTEYGWTWVSLEPWGNIAFHYGSWVRDSFYGWIWVPGYVWAPAWVTWVYTDFYIGWAPLPPHFRFHRHHGFEDHHHRPHYGDCVFVAADRMTDRELGRYSVPMERNFGIMQSAQVATTIGVVNNHVVNQGPSTVQMERLKLHRTPIREASNEIGIRPKPIQILGDNPDIELSPTKVNNEGAKRVIKDFDREQRAAKADRERQLNVEQNKADRIKVNPEPKRRIEEPVQIQPPANENKEQRRIERDSRRQQEEQMRRQQEEQLRIERENRRQQQEQQRRQQEEQKKLDRMQNRQDQKPYRIEQPDQRKNQPPNQQKETPKKHEGEKKEHRQDGGNQTNQNPHRKRF